MMNLLPRRIALPLAGLLVLGLLSVLTACDDETVAPRVTVPEFDTPEPAEVLLEVPTDEASATSEEITVDYRGLDAVPDIEASVDGDVGSLEVVGRSDSGSPDEGSVSFALSFSYPDASVIDPAEATVEISGFNEELNRGASASINVDIQKILPEVTSDQTSLSFEIPEGETASEDRELVVSYRSLDDVPTFELQNEEGPGEFIVEAGESEGSAEDGSTTYIIRYESDDVTTESTADLVFEGSNANLEMDATHTVALTGSGELLGVDGQAGVNTDFLNVADYEERSITEFGPLLGPASSEIVRDAPAEAGGAESLSITGPLGSGVTLEREAQLNGVDRFSFYAKGDPDRIVDLEWTFRDDAGGEAEFTQSLERNAPWLYYEVSAEEAGIDMLNGNLVEIDVEIGRISEDDEVTFLIDDLNFGNEDGTLFSYFDFDEATFNYEFGDFSRDFTNDVDPDSYGTRARTKTGNDDDGGTGFGFNYDWIGLPDADLENDVLSMRIGNVSDDFTLFIFLETRGDIGGFVFDSGIEISIPAGAEWEVYEVPLGQLGDDASALDSQNGEGALRNVGFEIRDASDDVTFFMDDILIRRGN